MERMPDSWTWGNHGTSAIGEMGRKKSRRLLESAEGGNGMAKRVYVVHCPDGLTLKVAVGNEQVPMDQFLRKHIPIQVTSLTHFNPGQTIETIGLIIAEEGSQLIGIPPKE